MADKIVNRQVNIYIQSGEAQKALDALIKKEERLKEELRLATDPEAIKNLTAQLSTMAAPIDAARKASQQAKLEFNDLISKEKTLLAELKNSSDATRNQAIKTELEKLPVLMDAARRKVAETKRDLDGLIAKEKELKTAIANASDPKVVEKLRLELDRLKEPIDRATKKLNGELEPSLRDTEAAARKVRAEFSKMSAGDAGYKEMQQAFHQSTIELEQQRTKMGFLQRAMRSFWQEAKTVAVGVLVGQTIQTMFQTVLSYVAGMVTGSAKIADELSAIEKTTGLTKQQVREVNGELSKIDTRTSTTQLRELATVAGQMGKESVQDVKKFVEEADQINVALGDELGKEAIPQLAKLENIFHTSMLNIGSAINEISDASVATAPFQVDFLSRLAGVAPTAKLAIDELLGYGATLEGLGQTTEVAGTALNGFFIDFTRDTEKFGQAAGFAKGELTKLLQTKGTNEAFLSFLEKLKQGNPDAAEFLKKMQQLGIDGARGSSVLLALANNTKSVREQQLIANKAYKEGISITKEFGKVNNNEAGELDKLKKNFASLFASNTVREAGAATVRTLNSVINVLKAMPAFIDQNRFAILTLLAGVVLLNGAYIKASLSVLSNSAATALNTIQKRIGAFATETQVAAELVHADVLALLTGRITLATAAQRIWATVTSLSAGPIGVIIVAVAALAFGLAKLYNSLTSVTSQQRVQAELSKKIVEATAEEIAQTNYLQRVASDLNNSYETRKQALDELIKKSPEYLGRLTLENIATQEGTTILGNYISKLREAAQAKAKSELAVEKEKRKVEIETELTELRAGTNISGLGDVATLLTPFGKDNADKIGEITAKERELKEVNEDLDTLYGSMGGKVSNTLIQPADAVRSVAAAKAVQESINSLKEKLTGLQTSRDASTSDSERSSLNKQIKQTEEAIARLEGRTTSSGKAAIKAAKDYKQLEDELRSMATELAGSGINNFSKDLAQLDAKYDKLRQRAQGNNKLSLEVEKLFLEERSQLVQKYVKIEFEKLSKAEEQLSKLDQEKKEREISRTVATFTNQMIRLGTNLNKDTIARDELDILRKQGKARLQAQLQLLKDQEQQELANTELTEQQKELIREQYRRRRGDAEKNYLIADLQQALEFAKSALDIYGIFADAKTQRENADLARDQKINEKKKANLDRQLKAGVLSQLDYDRKVQKLEKDQEKREIEIKKRQFKRNQEIQISQTLMNGAQAVVSIIAQYPKFDFGVAAAIAVGLAIATTAASVATIAKQKAPEYGRGGGFLTGPSHSDKLRGMPVTHPYTGKVQAYLEGGEGIGSKKTMSDQRRYDISGTPSQIFSYLNGVNGGVQWQSGAVLKPGWKEQKPLRMASKTINNSINTVRTFYATGGVFGESATTSGSNSGEKSNTSENSSALLFEIMAVLRSLSETNASLLASNVALQNAIATLQANGVNAYMLLSESERQQKRIDAIRDAATMKA